MTETTNYKLKKPESNEYIGIGVINENMDIIDENLRKAADGIEKVATHRNITLAAADWSDNYPYTQTVSAEGITADSNVKVIGLFVADGSTEDQVKAIKKAAGFLVSNTSGTGNGTLTFKAYKKPETDFTIVVEGG